MPTGYSMTSYRRADLLVAGVGPVQLGQAAPGVEVGQVGVAHQRVALLAVLPGVGVAGRLLHHARGRRSPPPSPGPPGRGVHQGCRPARDPSGPPTPSLSAPTTGSSRVGWTCGGSVTGQPQRGSSCMAEDLSHGRPARRRCCCPARPWGSTRAARRALRRRRRGRRRRLGRASARRVAARRRRRLGRRRRLLGLGRLRRRPPAPARGPTSGASPSTYTGSGNSSTGRPSIIVVITAVQVRAG